VGNPGGGELIVTTWRREPFAHRWQSGSDFTPAYRYDQTPSALHPVTVPEIDGARVKVRPIEAFEGTPVVDIKSASTRAEQ